MSGHFTPMCSTKFPNYGKPCRLISYPGEYQTQEILLSPSTSTGRGSECIIMPLELYDGICFSSSPIHLEVSLLRLLREPVQVLAVLAKETMVSASHAPQCESPYQNSSLPTTIDSRQVSSSRPIKCGSLNMEVGDLSC